MSTLSGGGRQALKDDPDDAHQRVTRIVPSILPKTVTSRKMTCSARRSVDFLCRKYVSTAGLNPILGAAHHHQRQPDMRPFLPPTKTQQ